MSDLRKMARDAGFNTEFDDYVIDHWQRFEKFARLINAEALAQHEEPVLWVMPDGKTADKWALQFYGGQAGEPLYKAPPQRNTLPLSDDEIKCIKPICADFVSFRAGVRHAEREHGIGGEK